MIPDVSWSQLLQGGECGHEWTLAHLSDDLCEEDWLCSRCGAGLSRMAPREMAMGDGLGLMRGLLSATCLYVTVGGGIMAMVDGWPWTVVFLLGVIGLGRIWILDAR